MGKDWIDKYYKTRKVFVSIVSLIGIALIVAAVVTKARLYLTICMLLILGATIVILLVNMIVMQVYESCDEKDDESVVIDKKNREEILNDDYE